MAAAPEGPPSAPPPASPAAHRPPASGTALLIAGDVGGTHARLVLTSAAGEHLADVEGPGANLRSSGPEALDALASTVERLLGTSGGPPAAARVRALALGISGAGPARAAEIRAALTARLGALGIDPGAVLVTDDHLTAFLAGGVGDDGLLLLAGTGAVAVRFAARAPVARRDGMGWLLGDQGSAVWLGRRTLRAVAADLDARGPRTALTGLVGQLLSLDLRGTGTIGSPTGDPRQDLIRALEDHVPTGHPAALGRFAPLPAQVPADRVAARILQDATDHLVAAVRSLDPHGGLPVVLAGSVLASPGPIRERVRAALAAEGRELATAASGLPGALLLARDHAARPSC